MTSNALTERTMETSISLKARIAGALYLISIVARMLVEIVVRNRLVVSGDSGTTATNIMGHESLFQYGFAGDIISFATYIALTALLYELFKPVNSSLSLIAAFFSLVACVLQAISSVFHLAPLLLLRGAAYLSAYTVGQLQALALLFLRFRFEAYHMGLIFLGLYCLFLGILILTSTFLPRFLGVLMVLGGLSYLPFLPRVGTLAAALPPNIPRCRTDIAMPVALRDGRECASLE